jgi:hypothetical protein
LKFLGALQLKPGRREKRERILEQVEAHFAQTRDIRDFTTSDGYVASLKLTGDNLHGNNNKIYRAKEGVSTIDEEDIRKAMDIENPIGDLGIFNAEDYEKSNADFDQHWSIGLDRYVWTGRKRLDIMCVSFCLRYLAFIARRYGPFLPSGMYGKCAVSRVEFLSLAFSHSIPFVPRSENVDAF